MDDNRKTKIEGKWNRNHSKRASDYYLLHVEDTDTYRLQVTSYLTITLVF